MTPTAGVNAPADETVATAKAGCVIMHLQAKQGSRPITEHSPPNAEPDCGPKAGVLAAAPKDAAPNVEVAPPKAGVEAAPKAGADAAPNAGVEAGTGLAPKAGAELPPNPPKVGVEPPPKLKPPPVDAAPNAGVEGVLAPNALWDAAAPNPPACRSALKRSFLSRWGC